MKEIFSANFDIEKNAYMNWQTQEDDLAGNLVVLARGFKLSAEKLMNDILSDNSSKDADILIFPIMYSIDQSIELYLKAVIFELEKLMMENHNKYRTHDIRLLLQTVVSKIKIKGIKTKGLQNHINPLVEYINELYSHIALEDQNPKMDFARYPFDADKNPHFYICINENIVVDIENLKKRYDEIIESVESLYFLYQAELEVESEILNY